jgi:hypothetical protein
MDRQAFENAIESHHAGLVQQLTSCSMITRRQWTWPIPTGWVIATYETAEAGDASVLRSTDGSDWTVEDLGINPRAIAWTPTFGLVALGDDSVAFFRELAP